MLASVTIACASASASGVHFRAMVDMYIFILFFVTTSASVFAPTIYHITSAPAPAPTGEGITLAPAPTPTSAPHPPTELSPEQHLLIPPASLPCNQVKPHKVGGRFAHR